MAASWTAAHPPDTQASQQLAWLPTVAVPCLGALHLPASCLMEHFVTPLAVVRQHVTNPGFPQVDRAAHMWIGCAELFGSVPIFTAAVRCCATHLTYAP